MQRALGLQTEVLGRGDQRRAEQHIPDAVDVGAGDERIALVHQPARKPETIVGGGLGPGVQRVGRAGLDQLAGVVKTAPQAQMRRSRGILALAQHQRAIDLRPLQRLLRLLDRVVVGPIVTQRLQPVAQLRTLLLLPGRRHLEHDLVLGLEERDQPVVVALGDRIVLVVMATRTPEGAAEPDGRRRVGAVEQPLPARLGRVDAALVVQHRVAVKARRDARALVGVRQQVAGQLLDREAIERQIAVERIDDPVAPLPHRPRAVEVVAVGVGIAREIEPRTRPVLAVV